MLVWCSGPNSLGLGKRVCFRKVEYPPPNVFKFYALFSTRKNESVSTSVSFSYGFFGPGLACVRFVVAYVEVLHL